MHYDDETGTFKQSVTHFEQRLASYKVKPAVTIPYTLDLSTAQEDASLVITKLQTAGVTSVILVSDPVFPTFLTKEATKQGYFPEWVVLGYAFTDTTVFGRQYDQRQWAHAFGVSLLPARTADAIDELGKPDHVADRPATGGKDVPRACAGAADLLHRGPPRGPATHGADVPRRALPLPVGHRHHTHARALFVGPSRSVERGRCHRR